jgi:hypothetical protein
MVTAKHTSRGGVELFCRIVLVGCFSCRFSSGYKIKNNGNTFYYFFSECDSGEISEQRWPLRGIPALKKFLAWTGQEATINRYRYLVCMSDI